MVPSVASAQWLGHACCAPFAVELVPRVKETASRMAIYVKLDRMLLERRMSLTELSEQVGVTIANLSILKTGKAKASL